MNSREFFNDLADALFVVGLAAINAIWLVPLIAIVGANVVWAVLYGEIKAAIEPEAKRGPL